MRPTAAVLGPAWADTRSKEPGALNPLRVQNHVTSSAGRLVPAVTVITTGARYFGLHPWLATVAADRGLDREGFEDLVRRAEVVLAWTQAHHPSCLVDLPAAHGEDALGRFTSSGVLDLSAASQPFASAQGPAGFLSTTYRASERQLGLLAGGRPGPRFDQRAGLAVGPALTPLLRLAAQSTLDAADAAQAADAGLCLCATPEAPDGAWLRDLFWGRLGGNHWVNEDDARRKTASLLVRAIARSPGPVADPLVALRTALAYGTPDQQAAVAGDCVQVANAWRGLLLRHLMVTAWRGLWAAVYEECLGQSAGEIGASIAGHFPDISVREFIDLVGPTANGDRLLPVEVEVRERFDEPVRYLAMLVVSSQRATQLAGDALVVLCGDDANELGPGWLHAEITSEHDQPLRHWVRRLVEMLLLRSQRIALSKFSLGEDGRAVMPTTVRERDGLWFQGSRAGSAPLNPRLVPLAYVLAGCGILGHRNETWTVTETGRSLAGVT